MNHPQRELVDFSRTLANPTERFAILAEGNVSIRDSSDPTGQFWVKASGVEMARAEPDDFVALHLPTVLEFIRGDASGDDAVSEMFASAGRGGGRRPSVEALLHAVCLSDPTVVAVAHSHPEAVLAILCSQHPELIVAGSLFPDEIVVLGRHRMLVPYVDPGITLARAVLSVLTTHRQQHGSTPRVIYLQNHGIFTLGGSAHEALHITQMAEKCARVLLNTAQLGGANFLADGDASRIDTRPDEIHRRRLLASVERS